MRTLPQRTSTMAEAIALSSPSGHMSKRARQAANKRLELALFGEQGIDAAIAPQITQPSERESLLQQASELRSLANRGMRVSKYTKQADKLEAQAVLLS